MTEELKDFFPTPKTLMKKMTEKIVRISNISILEPSAGRGDIIEYIQNNQKEIFRCRTELKEIECIEKNQITKNIEFPYFIATFYKKGTCHIKFKNDELLLKFNIYGSQMKNWLPPSYGRKKYQDMTQEEKEVIDSFQGEKEYSKVVNNYDKYIYNVKNINLLTF